MRKIEAIIAPFEFDALQAALHDAGLRGMTVSEVNASDDGASEPRLYRGSEYTVDFLPRLKVELLVADADAAVATAAIERSVHGGGAGEMRILVSAIEDVIRIRTGERGLGAI